MLSSPIFPTISKISRGFNSNLFWWIRLVYKSDIIDEQCFQISKLCSHHRRLYDIFNAPSVFCNVGASSKDILSGNRQMCFLKDCIAALFVLKKSMRMFVFFDLRWKLIFAVGLEADIRFVCFAKICRDRQSQQKILLILFVRHTI